MKQNLFFIRMKRIFPYIFTCEGVNMKYATRRGKSTDNLLIFAGWSKALPIEAISHFLIWWKFELSDCSMNQPKVIGEFVQTVNKMSGEFDLVPFKDIFWFIHNIPEKLVDSPIILMASIVKNRSQELLLRVSLIRFACKCLPWL